MRAALAHDATPQTLTFDGRAVLTDARGDIDPSSAHGFYAGDRRVLSRLRVLVDGRTPALVSSGTEGACQAWSVLSLRANADGDPTAALIRRRSLDDDLEEQLELLAFDEVACHRVEILVEADFAPALKGSVTESSTGAASLEPRGSASLGADVNGIGIAVSVRMPSESSAAAPGEPDVRDMGDVGDVYVRCDGREVGDERERREGDDAHDDCHPVIVSPGRLAVWLTAPAGGRASLTLRAQPRLVGAVAATGNQPPAAEQPEDLEVPEPAAWRRAIDGGLQDLAALRLRSGTQRGVWSAGVPWFQALFGRDALLTAWATLICGPDMSIDVLDELAAHQGRRTDHDTGEQPGRILHELRTGTVGVFGVPPGSPLYASLDATPLFVMLLAEAARWGAPVERVTALLPHARAALAWCEQHGDLDGDGLLEHAADAGGLINQSWKDSSDAMVHADGRPATGPIAPAEVQAYWSAALRGMAELERQHGLGEAAAARLRQQSETVAQRLQERFWLPRDGLLAMALDGDKAPLRVASSNMGHCLWSGTLDDDVAHGVAARLAAEDLASDWGIRTLGSGEAAYNPFGYHRGAIWPHDTAIGVAGLARHGQREAASALVEATLAAAEHFDGRLPELHAGLAEPTAAAPVNHPGACRPQAWSAAAPLLLLRSELGLEPDVPSGRVRIAPLRPQPQALEVRGIRLGAGRLEVRVEGAQVDVDAPAGLNVDTDE